MNLVCVFPGQGSQKVGMGKEIFSEFSDVILQANDILGYSVIDVCLNNTNNYLDQTLYVQPAMYIVNALSYKKWLHDNNITPVFLLGHSLGEYNALLAAEVFDFITGLQLVKKRAELMQTVATGAMAAITGILIEDVAEIIFDYKLDVNIANYNSYTQVVIAGTKSNIENARGHFEKIGGGFHMLKTSGAFHSKYLNSIRDEFEVFLQKFNFATPKIPVIANISAETYQQDQIVDNLSWHLVSPVRWCKSIENIIRGDMDYKFIEIGPGNVLTRIIENIKLNK